MDQRTSNLLGLAMRARKLVMGDKLIPGIQNQSVKLVLIASDASENTKKKLTDKCTYYGIEWMLIDDSVSLSRAIGKVNRMAVGVIDEGFSKKISDCMKG